MTEEIWITLIIMLGLVVITATIAGAYVIFDAGLIKYLMHRTTEREE